MPKNSRICQMIALTRRCIAGEITAAELHTGIGDILRGQEQLPLGVGAVMPTEGEKQP